MSDQKSTMGRAVLAGGRALAARCSREPSFARAAAAPTDRRSFDPYNTASFDRSKNWARVGKR